MKIHNKIVLFSCSLILLGLGSCKKSYLDRVPTSEAPLSDIFKTTVSSEAALQGLHRLMYDVPSGRQDDQFGQKSIDLYNDLMGDDMPLTDRGSGWFMSMYSYSAPRTTEAPGSYPWVFYFGMINNANQIIVNIDNATGPQEDKDNIKGQALFYRAYAYYNLSLYYQFTYLVDETALGLPLYDEPTRVGKGRSTMKETYDFILNDLSASRALLAGSSSRNDKSAINIDVVNAISARIALSMGKWTDAANYANAARQSYPFMNSRDLLDGFNSINNSEWIWGSKMVDDQTSNVASFLGQMDIASGGYAALGQQKLVSRNLFITIPSNDIRKNWWYAKSEGRYQGFSQKKFRVKVAGTFGTDVSYVRSAEMALIEAEALCMNNDLAGSKAVLSSLITTRQPDYDVDQFTTQTDLFKEIIRQRRIELWGEGFRYSDIKRFAPALYLQRGLLSAGDLGLHREGNGGNKTLMGQVTIADPLSPLFVFRIPSSEINLNPAMQGQQNP